MKRNLVRSQEDVFVSFGGRNDDLIRLRDGC